MTSELCPRGEPQNKYPCSRIWTDAMNTAVNKLMALNIDTSVFSTKLSFGPTDRSLLGCKDLCASVVFFSRNLKSQYQKYAA